MLCGWGDNRRPGGKQWQPIAGWMTYCGLTACTRGSAPGPTLGIEYGSASLHDVVRGCMQYVDRFPLPYAIETTSIQANRAPTGDLVVTAAINDSSSEDSDTENC